MSNGSSAAAPPQKFLVSIWLKNNTSFQFYATFRGDADRAVFALGPYIHRAGVYEVDPQGELREVVRIGPAVTDPDFYCAP